MKNTVAKLWNLMIINGFRYSIGRLPPTPTPTNTPSNTVTPTITVSPTNTPSNTMTPTITVTPSITKPNVTVTSSVTVTPTTTPTVTASPSLTPTVTATRTVTPSITPSITITPTITPSTGSGVSFAPNRPAGLSTLFDRVFNKTDSHITGGVLPTLNGSVDSYGLEWFGQSGNQSQLPFIDTPANISSTIGSTVTAPPDGNSTILAVYYPINYPIGNTPFQLQWNGSLSLHKMYACCYVWMPANFSSSGNNIKWMGVQQDSTGNNHIMMLSSNGSGVVSTAGSGKDYRSNWFVVQGGSGDNNLGGEGQAATPAPIKALTTVGFNPTGSGNGWWNSMYGTWVLCEWFVQQESPAGAANGIFQGWCNGVLINSWNNITFNQVSGGAGVFNIWNFIPYYGGGGSKAPAAEYLCVSRMQVAGS